ncbi:MAG: AAA family ATPase [Cyanobacteria bacterium J06638_20]
MEPVGLLATIVGVCVTALKPENLVGTALEGIIGNRVDAAFMTGYDAALQTFRNAGQETHRELQVAIWRSVLLAQYTIADECRKELLGGFARQYRGHPDYPPQHKEMLQWLDRKREKLSAQRKSLEDPQNQAQMVIAAESLEALLIPTSRSVTDQIAMVKRQLWDEALKDGSIPIYTSKIKQDQTGLFERVCALFMAELKNDPAVRVLFEEQLLAQLNAQLKDQQLSIQDIERALQTVAQDVPHVLVKLDALERVVQDGNLQIGQELGEVLEIVTTSSENLATIKIYLTELVKQGRVIASVEGKARLMQVTTELPPNPFVPLNGRVDDVSQLFIRQKILNRVFERLNGGSSVALVGERAIGKSSLLWMIQQQANKRLQPSRQPIYLDLKLIGEDDDFYSALCEQAQIPECRGYRLSRQLRSRRVLLLLDEVEKMTWAGFSKELRGQLRGLAEGSDAPLRLVLASCTSLDRLFPDNQEEGMVSPLSGVCIPEPIDRWDEPTTREFITSRLTRTPIRFTEAEIQQLWRESNGHPRQLMQACHACYARYQEENT